MDIITSKRKLKKPNTIHLQYVDDLKVAESLNLTEQLKVVPIKERMPDNYHARTEHALDNKDSIVFKQLQQLESYSEENKMKLNLKKNQTTLALNGQDRTYKLWRKQ